MNAKKTAVAGMLAALALILGWVEHMLPLNPAIPGLRLGLGNLAVVSALYLLGPLPAAAVSAAKVLLSALLFGSVSGLMYSAAGAAVSFATMLLLHRLDHLSPVGVSAAGGAAHIAAQFAVAALATSTPALLRLMPPLLAVGTLTGALLGLAALLTLRRIPAALPGLFLAKGGRPDE